MNILQGLLTKKQIVATHFQRVKGGTMQDFYKNYFNAVTFKIEHSVGGGNPLSNADSSNLDNLFRGNSNLRGCSGD